MTKKRYIGPGKEIQTLIFPKSKFTRQQALSWAKKHGFKHYTSNIDPNTIRVRQFPPNLIKKTLGTFEVDKGIKALYVVKK